MPKFRVLFSVDATVSVTVEATNRGAAQEKAWDVVERPCICHQCSDELEVGDVLDILEVVSDE